MTVLCTCHKSLDEIRKGGWMKELLLLSSETLTATMSFPCPRNSDHVMERSLLPHLPSIAFAFAKLLQLPHSTPIQPSDCPPSRLVVKIGQWDGDLRRKGTSLSCELETNTYWL